MLTCTWHSNDFKSFAAARYGGADDDARAFDAWVRDRRAEVTDELIESEERMARLINALLVTIGEVEPFIMPNMVGDLIAARSLASAAKTIQTTNEAEAKGGRGRQ
jgi:hypothetical protein